MKALEFYECKPETIQAIDLLFEEHGFDISDESEFRIVEGSQFKASSVIGKLAAMTEVAASINDPQLTSLVDEVCLMEGPKKYNDVNILRLSMIQDSIAEINERSDLGLGLSFQTIEDHVRGWSLTNEALRQELETPETIEALEKLGGIYACHLIEAIKILLQHRANRLSREKVGVFFDQFFEGLPEIEVVQFMTISMMAISAVQK